MDVKHAKEAFVTGHLGTSALEVSIISSIPALLLLIHAHLAGAARPKGSTSIIRDVLVFVLPQILALLGPLSPSTVCTAAAVGAAILHSRHVAYGKLGAVAAVDYSEALAAYRANLMLITCVAILGVDFHAFPRRFAKAETFGTGLMDAGVGSIVVASAIASGMHAAHVAPPSSNGRASREAARLAVLVMLGAGKAAFAAASDYQVHVGEYGVHWNFFLTLAALRILKLAVPRSICRSALQSAALGIAVLASHQFLLSRGKFIGFIHAEQRGNDFLSANKEGVLSLPGYCAMQLLGNSCGCWLQPLHQGSRGTPAPASELIKQRGGATLTWLAALTAVLWTSYTALAALLQPSSRRACNATYVMWMLALNLQSLGLVAGVQALSPARRLPVLLRAINSSMLATFLVANVLTGTVNMCIDTLGASDWAARVVVGVYMAAVCTASLSTGS